MGCLEFDVKYATKMGILRYPTSTAQYGDVDLSQLIKKKEVDNRQSQYELDKDIVNRLLRLIPKMNPELYDNVMGNSTSRLWAKSGGPTYGDDNIIRPPQKTLFLGRKRLKRTSKSTIMLYQMPDRFTSSIYRQTEFSCNVRCLFQ